MKNFIVLSFLLFTASISAYSQTEWAPIGAMWYYGFAVPFDAHYGYITLESVKDTVIDTKICKKINRISNYEYYTNPQVLSRNEGFYLMYSNQGKVYNYYLSKFHLLYDFSLNAGDTLRAQLNPYYNDTAITNYLIDSISYINYSGKKLKRQYFHYIDTFNPYPDKWFNYGYFIENVGHTGWMFGHESIEYDQFGANLRCYSDSYVSFNRNLTVSCDSIMNPYLRIENEKPNDIYIQNPIENDLISKYTDSKPYNILIINNMGIKMAGINHVTSDMFIVPTALYVKGIYYLILYNDKTRLTKKFVKL